MAPRFEPEDYQEVAEQIATAADEQNPQQAWLRTAVSRAYYAVHGYVRQKLCDAYGGPKSSMFGGRGRHSPVAHALGDSRYFDDATVGKIKSLLLERVHADYHYEEEQNFSAQEAREAVEDAADTLADLNPNPEFYRGPAQQLRDSLDEDRY